MKVFMGILAFLIITAAGLWYYVQYTYPATSPQTSALYFSEHLLHPHAKLDKYIIGFLPYWRIDDMKYVRLDVLSEVNYFSLSADGQGHIIKQLTNETEPGWREWDKQSLRDFITKTQIMGTDFTITIAVLENETIESILDDKIAQKELISEIIDLVKTNHLNGITLDFEYLGEPDEEYRMAFTSFTKELSAQMHAQVPNTHLSLTLMPRDSQADGLFDLPKLVPVVDRFIGMSYDYYGVGATIAGPVAPMKGFKEDKFFYDVETTYANLLKTIPAKKLVMGVPYYGWDRAVIDGQTIQSKTLPADDPNNSAVVMSYARMRESNDIKKSQCQWDDYALSTWCWYTDEDNIDHQVWLEDNKSLGIKFDYAKKQKFAGVAIWNLGYDKNYPDLWNLMKNKYQTK